MKYGKITLFQEPELSPFLGSHLRLNWCFAQICVSLIFIYYVWIIVYFNHFHFSIFGFYCFYIRFIQEIYIILKIELSPFFDNQPCLKYDCQHFFFFIFHVLCVGNLKCQSAFHYNVKILKFLCPYSRVNIVHFVKSLMYEN